MKTFKLSLPGLLFLLLIVSFSCQKDRIATDQSADTNSRLAFLTAKNNFAVSSNVTVFATGLNNPRGLAFSPDGTLYVAEGGTGGTGSTIGQCTQVAFPVGPYVGSATGSRVSKISAQGVRTTVGTALPSSAANEIIGGDIEGVGDVAFVGNTLYAVLAGAGCSHGVSSMPNALIRLNANNTWSMVANLSAYQQSHPVSLTAGDFEPDGVWYSLLNVRNDLYAIEPNHGELVRISTDGAVTRIKDFTVDYGHIVPTSMAYHGNFYVGNLSTFPAAGGASNIYKVSPDGSSEIVATGFNMVLGVAIDQQKRMYVLEMTAGAPFPTEGLGRITKVDPNGTKTVIASGLSLPTAMELGPDGKLYVSNIGLGPASIGGGQILRVTIP